MRGYPKGPLSKQDFDNMLAMPEHAEKAKVDLMKLAAVNDAKIIIDEGTQEKPSLKQIINPLPAWKRVGFKSKAELVNLAAFEDVNYSGLKTGVSATPTLAERL